LTIYAVFQRSPPPQDGSGKSHCTVDLSDAKHYTDLDEMLRDPKIDLCVVVTRHDTHVPFAIKALQAGKHGRH
jgi:predicted dehydrogenase